MGGEEWRPLPVEVLPVGGELKGGLDNGGENCGIVVGGDDEMGGETCKGTRYRVEDPSEPGPLPPAVFG